jgi:hypothetical protein
VSKTIKEGKRRWRTFKSPPSNEDAKLSETVSSRHSYGRTEKILRRNRKIWTRLLNKRRRVVDKAKVDEAL